MELAKAGVFSPCLNLDSSTMINLLQTLLSDYPSIEFNEVVMDKKNHGFKVFFSEPDSSVVLEKNQLLSEESFSIYPLAAHLVILNVDHRKTPHYERDLRNTIKDKIGEVLKIEKADNLVQSKNWIIKIDVPEFRDLEPFRESSIILSIPLREEVILKLFCIECKGWGHFQHECFDRLSRNIRKSNIKEAEKRKSYGKTGENFKQHRISSPDQNSERIPKTFSNFSFEPTDRYAEKIGREEVMSFSKEKAKYKQNHTTTKMEENIKNSILALAENDIKKENVDVEPVQNIIRQENKNIQNKIQKCFKNRANEDISNKSQDMYSNHSDDEVEFIDFRENSSSNKSPSNSYSRGAEDNNFDEESRSSPETKSANFSNVSFPIIPGPSRDSPAVASFPTTPGPSRDSPAVTSFPTTPGPSHDSPAIAAKAPRGAEITTSLSERLQYCINKVCEENGVLDRKQLDAFLIHVKKKSNPIRVALNFTKDTGGLKKQLQDILHVYYNTPQTGTKEDMQFIKWLSGLVDRYDGSIPKKRKRSGKTDDEYNPKR